MKGPVAKKATGKQEGSAGYDRQEPTARGPAHTQQHDPMETHEVASSTTKHTRSCARAGPLPGWPQESAQSA